MKATTLGTLAMVLLLVNQGSATAGMITISQVYGGGGNSGATYKNDFIEILNTSPNSINLNGWSVQFAAATGTTWVVTPLSNWTLQPGQYYLIQEAQGAGGTVNLPTPDATGTINMSATTGKVALVNTTTALSGAIGNGTGPNIVDFVGYGSTANGFEGTGPAPTLSITTAALRSNTGLTDTDNNAADFSGGAPTPRNTASPFAAVAAVPEPSSFLLCSLAAAAAVVFARRQQKGNLPEAMGLSAAE